MKKLFQFLHKNVFLYLSIISLLTACEAADNMPPHESAVVALTTDTQISQESSDTDRYTSPDDDFKADSSAPHSISASEALVPDTAASDTTAPETVFRISSSADTVSTSPLSELQIHFIDVGQGDATLIICGNESMLIDAGDNNMGTTIQLYLQRQGIENLTYIIGTHPDSDHIGGLDVIMTKFDCGTIIMPDVSSDTAAYRDVMNAMKYRNYVNTLPQTGDIYNLDDAEFTIIAPNNEYTDDNNSSVGIKLIHGNNAFLFTGDAETEAEADIMQNGIDLKADVLHVGHHGSSTSNSSDFISAVSPAYAVISCGNDNPYGHPHDQTLNTLKEHNIQVFRTDEQGNIMAISNGKSIVWNVAPSQTWKTGKRAESQTDSVSSEDTAVPKPDSGITTPETDTITYVLNLNTNRFHKPGCPSVNTIKESNREDTSMSRDEITAAGFIPCKNCNP